MGLTSDSLPTAQYAVRRLRELGETPPNFADLRRKTNDEALGDKTATEISPRADSAAVLPIPPSITARTAFGVSKLDTTPQRAARNPTRPNRRAPQNQT